MKKIVISFSLLFALAAHAQENKTITPAAKDVVYGAALSSNSDAISINDLQAKMAGQAFEGKVSGRVKEVCKSMGCWIKLEKADGSTVMVKSKDHGFFMPQDLVGRQVVVEGTASTKEVSQEQRRHLAEDAGKSKSEIKKIKGTQQEVQIVASGVQVVE